MSKVCDLSAVGNLNLWMQAGIGYQEIKFKHFVIKYIHLQAQTVKKLHLYKLSKNTSSRKKCLESPAA
jgi:hypothetical protein